MLVNCLRLICNYTFFTIFEDFNKKTCDFFESFIENQVYLSLYFLVADTSMVNDFSSSLPISYNGFRGTHLICVLVEW